MVDQLVSRSRAMNPDDNRPRPHAPPGEEASRYPRVVPGELLAAVESRTTKHGHVRRMGWAWARTGSRRSSGARAKATCCAP